MPDTKQLVLFILSVIATYNVCSAQDLLKVNWQKIVCENGYIDHIEKVLTDKDGNIYTLGSFPNEAKILGESLTSANGAHFLAKQNSKGEKIFVKTFGNSRVNLAEGDMEFATNGDIVLSLDFRDSFYFDGKMLVQGDVYQTNGILLKVDSNFNLKWFKTYPSENVSRFTEIVLDKEDNIYCNILFFRFIEIDGKAYQIYEENYSNILVKYNPAGEVKWVRHFSASGNRMFTIGKFCDTCEDELIIIGETKDSLIIDDVLYGIYPTANSPDYMCILGLSGNVILSKFLDKRMLGISGLKMYNHRLFFAGDYSNLFIGELSKEGKIKMVTNFTTKDRCYVNDFNISPLYGFVVSGCYDGSFALQHANRTLRGEYERGSFIASFDESLKLNDCKFIDGGYYNLNKVLVDSNIITGAGIFRRTCSFDNANIFGWNDDISVFQTTDLKPLIHFQPDTLPQPPEVEPEPVESKPLYVNIYPNPFENKFNIVFNQPAEIKSISLTDAIGKVITNVGTHHVSDVELYIDASELAAGFYILKFQINQMEYTYKLIKIGK